MGYKSNQLISLYWGLGWKPCSLVAQFTATGSPVISQYKYVNCTLLIVVQTHCHITIVLQSSIPSSAVKNVEPVTEI